TGLYVQAQRMRRKVSEQVAECFEDFDILLGPTGEAAPAIDDMPGRDAPVPGLSTKRLAPQMQVFNLAGNPAMSVPSGFDEQGLPLGVQLAGRHFDEATVLRAAHAYQSRMPWHLTYPKGLD